MGWGSEHDAVRRVVIDYLEGMIWGDEEKLRRAFHPKALQVGHFADTYEFFPLDEFIAWLKLEETEPVGSAYDAELLAVEVTGTVAVAKLSDTCFGTRGLHRLAVGRGARTVQDRRSQTDQGIPDAQRFAAC
jgi:hypothetical protein